MALVRGTPLLSTAAEVVDITGVQDLANLETGSEFSVADSLSRAHEWVFDMIEQRLGDSQPPLISNETRLERAVAARFLELLYANGYLGADQLEARDYWRAEARDEVARYRPQYSSGDEQRSTTGGIPEVGNFEGGWVFGPLDTGGTSNERYRRTLPRGW